MTTLQDMPDDVLGIIYSQLNIPDTVRCNISLHKSIKESKITDLIDGTKIDIIPKYYLHL